MPSSLPILDTTTEQKYPNLHVVKKSKDFNGTANFSNFSLACIIRGDACTKLEGARVTGSTQLTVLIPRFVNCQACVDFGIDKS
jgi:hypothetical protein